MTDRPDPRPLKGIHHGAFRCRDAAQTRWLVGANTALVALAITVAKLLF